MKKNTKLIARQTVAKNIAQIAKKKMKKAMQITNQKAKGSPIEKFPEKEGIRDLGKGYWTARIKVGETELLIEPISEKEPWLVRTTEGKKVRISNQFQKELNAVLWKMWEKLQSKRKVTIELRNI